MKQNQHNNNVAVIGENEKNLRDSMSQTVSLTGGIVDNVARIEELKGQKKAIELSENVPVYISSAHENTQRTNDIDAEIAQKQKIIAERMQNTPVVPVDKNIGGEAI